MGWGKRAEELLVMDEKNMRNCRDRANRNQSRMIQVQVTLLWGMGQTTCPLQGPSSLSPAIAVPVCCRKTPFSASHTGISPFPSVQDPKQHAGCSSSAWSSCGCRCSGVSLIPSPLSCAQLHPPQHRSVDQNSGQQRADCWIQLAAMLSPS